MPKKNFSETAPVCQQSSPALTIKIQIQSNKDTIKNQQKVLIQNQTKSIEKLESNKENYQNQNKEFLINIYIYFNYDDMINLQYIIVFMNIIRLRNFLKPKFLKTYISSSPVKLAQYNIRLSSSFQTLLFKNHYQLAVFDPNNHQSFKLKEEQSKQLTQQANQFIKNGNNQQAMELLKKIYKIQVEIYDKNNVQLAKTINNLGLCFLYKNEYDDAIKKFKESLDIILKIQPDSYQYLSVLYLNLADAYEGKSEFQTTINYLLKLREVHQKQHGEINVGVLETLNRIGLIYNVMRDLDKAKIFFNKCLEICLQLYGQSSIWTAKILNNIGIYHEHKSNYDQAIKYYEKSLKVELENTQENQQTAVTYNNIGSCYNNKCQFDRALQYFKKSLELQLKYLGDDHSDTAITYSNMANSYERKGQTDKSLQLLNKGLIIQIKAFGENHPQTSITLNNIGHIYHLKGKLQLALDHYTKALNIQLNILGENNPSTSTTYNNIANIYDEKGERQKALQYSLKSLKIAQNTLGERHPETANSLNNIGTMLLKNGQVDKALDYYLRSLNILEQIVGQEHLDTSFVMMNVGLAYEQKNMYAQALKFFKRSLSIRLNILDQRDKLISTLRQYIRRSEQKLKEE